MSLHLEYVVYVLFLCHALCGTVLGAFCHCTSRSMNAMDFSWYVQICISRKINFCIDFGEAFLLIIVFVKEDCHKTDFSIQVAPFYKLVCSFTGLLQFAFHCSYYVSCSLLELISFHHLHLVFFDGIHGQDNLERKFLKFCWEWVVIHGKTWYLVMPLESPLQVTNKFIH